LILTLSLQDFADVVSVLRDPMDRNAAAEKRRATRMSVSAKVSVHVLEKGHIGRAYTAFARDISLTGIGLLQSVVLQQGQEVLLTFGRPHGRPLMVVAKAMHSRPLADGLLSVGLEFSHVLADPTGKSDRQPLHASTPAVAAQ
jgi:hypothetical protein